MIKNTELLDFIRPISIEAGQILNKNFGKIQYIKEKEKFIAKFGALNPERAAIAKSQRINKEILSNTPII